MFRSFTYQTDYLFKDGDYFGVVNIINGVERLHSIVLDNIPRKTEDDALEDAAEYTRTMVFKGFLGPFEYAAIGRALDRDHKTIMEVLNKKRKIR